MSGNTYTSHPIGPPALTAPPAAGVPAELSRRLAESFGGWPQPWAIWQDVPMTPWGYPMSGAPFARGASGTTNDRMGGRNIPLAWTEVDLRGFRVLSRFLCDTNGFAIGFMDRLTDYHVRKGFAWQACRKGHKKTPYPTTANSTDELTRKAQGILDQWRDAHHWPAVEREAFRRWRRDGEVFSRLFFGGTGKFPAHRFVEPEQVGSPDGATSGPYGWGIETDPADPQTRWAYHLWDMESGQTAGEWVDAERMVHLAANVDSTIKRGLPDFFPLQDQLDGVRRLLRNIIETAAKAAAYAWMEKYPTATLDQIRGLIPTVAAERTGNGIGAYPFGSSPYGVGAVPRDAPPGSIMRVEGNRELEPTPVASGTAQYIEAEQAALRGCGARWGMPEYFSGDASNNSFSSSLVSGAPFAVAIEGGQVLFAGWERGVALRVLDLAADAGLLTRQERAALDVEVTEPAVISAEPDKDTGRRKTLFDSGVLSRTTWQLEEGYDPQHEQENQKAEGPAQPQQVQPQPGETQPGGGQTQGGGEQTLGDLFPSTESRVTEDHGPPPFPGAVFDAAAHRWKKPGDRTPAPKLQAKGQPAKASRTPAKPMSEKALRAQASATRVDSSIQRYAEEHNEPRFAKAVGGLSFKDNEPVDVVVGKGGVIRHGIELKTMVSNKANKITMKRSAMERKAEWEKNNKATFHTVVIDDSAVFNANGDGEHDESKRVIYYRRGFGSFRVPTMHRVKDVAELKKLLETPNDQLPDAAKRRAA